ncbi:MarR family transcriptional regulator [Hydrogenophaga crassostreae]|uniref:MarR family transcriptional regulator n=1 Tax=Hydrogenophaga crassostreae TaxID=1763535 RepID=A0A162P3G3_9BURK|nr:MarR family transcriptional regulator [Hydrogenophaga crassostreae]AOW12037.1 MarR family transcriptional regulator [Hydrogenophaga crassostreae]OAD40982.1 MarR family transcriptional regulator [Hydrogenophaga crassostreae]
MPKSFDIVNQKSSGQDDDVLEAIHAVMHLYRSQKYKALRDGPHDVTHMDSKVLGFFGRRPGATQSDLAQQSGRDKAQLARLIKGLRDRGLLAAEADEADRRNLRLSLTAEGAALQRSLQQEAKRLSTTAVAGFSAQEVQALKALLDRVKRNLDTEA